MESEDAPRSPGVRFPPPLLFVAGLVAGWLAERYLGGLALPPSAALRVLGIGLVALGVALALWGIFTFRAHRTSILPHHAASRLVLGGPYRFTRNPMYLGMSIAYFGASALMRTAWPLVFLPLVILALWRLVIRREEAYLTAAFGAEYQAFRARVGRWL